VLPMLFTLLITLPPASTPANLEVGLREKLGQTVPLDLKLTDSEGAEAPLRSLIKKPTILTLNYFRCAGLCSPQLNGLAEALNQVKLEPGKDFQVMTVSFDDRDTPAMAARKRANLLTEITRPFPPAAWRLFTGPTATTRTLADGVGFGFKRQGGDFIHPAALIILSPRGEVTRYLYGISYLPAELEQAIQEAAKEEPRPSVSKLQNICFRYDPGSRKYVFSVTRVVAAITLSIALVFVLALVLKGRRTKGRP